MERIGTLTQHLTAGEPAAGPAVADRVDKSDGAVAGKAHASLEENGYVIIENFVSRGDAAAQLSECRRLLEARPTGRQTFEGVKTKRLNSVFAKTDVFVDVAVDPLLVEIAQAQLGGEHFIASVAQVIEIHPGEAAQAPHRDDAMFPVERPHDEFVLSTMLALTDFNAANGATRLYAGSHRWESQPKARATHVITKGTGVRTWDEKRLRELERNGKPIRAAMDAGSLLLYKGSILHGGGANETEDTRLGFSLHLIQPWLQPQERMTLAVPRRKVREYPERLQRMLGWDVWPAFGGAVDGASPKKVLYSNDC